MKLKRFFSVFAVCLLIASVLGTAAQAAQSSAMTRGKWIAALYASHMAVVQASSGTSATSGSACTGFSDVGAESSSYPAVCWARAQGITKGLDEQRFQPDRPITRLQAAVMLYRYEQAYSKDTFAAEPQTGTVEWSAVPAWGRPAAVWAVSQGVWFSGSEALSPSEPLDTAEGNAMIYAAFSGGMKTSSVTISPDTDVEFSLSNVTSTGAAATLSNRGASVVTYGSDYFLQQKFHDTWYWRQDGGVFTMELCELQSGASISLQLNWENFCGALPAGEYRILKYVNVQSLPDGTMNRRPVAAEFTVD